MNFIAYNANKPLADVLPTYNNVLFVKHDEEQQGAVNNNH